MKILFIIVLFSCSVSLSAQNSEEKKDAPYKIIFNLRNDLDGLKKEMDKKDARIKKLEDELAKMILEKNKVDSLLKAEKTMGKSKEMKDQLKALEHEKTALRLKLDSCSSAKAKEINELTQNNKIQIQQLKQQHSNDSTEIASLKGDLEELRVFRKMWLTQLAESVNEKWFKKPYSKIDLTELEKEIKQYGEFASADKRVAEAHGKLKKLMNDCQIYNNGVSLIKTRYDRIKIAAVVNQVKELRDMASDLDKKKELSMLYNQLNDYGVTVQIFQEVIKAVDEQVKDNNVHKAALPLVKAVLERQEKEYEYITVIKNIPWLEEQYNEYFEILEKNCVGENKVRNIIMKIQP